MCRLSGNDYLFNRPHTWRDSEPRKFQRFTTLIFSGYLLRPFGKWRVDDQREATHPVPLWLFFLDSVQFFKEDLKLQILALNAAIVIVTVTVKCCPCLRSFL